MQFGIEINNENRYPSIVLKDMVTGSFTEIYSLGALLNSFTIKTHNGTINIIDGFKSVEEAAANTTNGFKSSKLSPFVCRLNKGKYNFNGNELSIEKFYLPPHAIHGIIFDAPFTIVSTNANDDFAEVILQYNYTSTDKGYPFNYTTTICWKLTINNNLFVTTTVENNNTFAIPMADGWHPYFTLGETIDDCIITIDSTEQVLFDETLIPTGEIIEDGRFINGAILKEVFLDNCFKLNTAGTSRCTLENDKLLLTIQPNNAYPFLQVYTPPHRKSIAIENLSAAPDAFNNNMGLLLIEPNKAYSFTTSYELTIKL